ncbi:MAG: aminotransferase class V-fold PLP-dependent enzyme [Thermohalobaculum sp.]|nr:aminotransferase class V-fold PLP-dependent enzyme [Thermohalobaculum sp.]
MTLADARPDNHLAGATRRPSLRHGLHFLSIPGPSVMPQRVLAAMARAMPNIYEGDLIARSEGILAALPGIARTTGTPFIAVANGHGAWEMALTNTLSRGDKVLVLESGRFAIGWGEMAKVLGLEVEILNARPRRAVDPDAVEARLRADPAHTIKAVMVVQIDTASSVRNDIAAIRKAIEAAGHPALYMVDCIASLGCVPFEMDAWGVDVTVAGSQKGLMVPPGLGFCWAGPRAMEACRRADLRTGYWDWLARAAKGQHYLRYCGTPPVSHLFALREALDMIAEEGLDNVWARHAALARAVRAAVAVWSTPGGIEFNVVEPAERSDAVTTVLTGGIDAARLRSVCEQRAGLTLGIAFAPNEGRAFRIGHMGHLNPPMILGTLATIEAALIGMGAPIGGSGIAAAATSIAADLGAELAPAGNAQGFNP